MTSLYIIHGRSHNTSFIHDIQREKINITICLLLPFVLCFGGIRSWVNEFLCISGGFGLFMLCVLFSIDESVLLCVCRASVFESSSEMNVEIT